MCGRTLFGAPPARGQQLEDHYFGTIKERILTCMCDVEEELFKLGVPAKTRHNEVAPSQFEIAPIFEEANIAVDHNHIIMETIKKIAARHNLAALLHEKPFARVNGSGKHLNWSLSDETGHNYLNPGNTPEDNIQFLLVLTAVIRAVYNNGDILRASVASNGNDHRLGANEAPPAIISVFLGDQLANIVRDIIGGKMSKATDQAIIDLGVSSLPLLSKDNTDRNRTSPFAFTGNKFEFRAVGSNMPISFPAAVLNTIVAESFEYLTAEISKMGGDVKQASFDVMKDVLKNSEAILFMGDNYSIEWEKEAEKRGLPNFKTTPNALKALISEKCLKMFAKYQVLSEIEMKSRYHIHLERYSKLQDIEAGSLYNMTMSQIVPAGMEYQSILADSIISAKELYGEKGISAQKKLFENVADLVNSIIEIAESLKDIMEKADSIKDEFAIAEYHCTKTKKAMLDLRDKIDTLEKFIPADIWPAPKYWEMLFLN